MIARVVGDATSSVNRVRKSLNDLGIACSGEVGWRFDSAAHDATDGRSPKLIFVVLTEGQARLQEALRQFGWGTGFHSPLSRCSTPACTNGSRSSPGA